MRSLLGRLSYFVALPGIWLVLLCTTRVRAVIVYQNKTLLAKSYLSAAGWQLLGGGLKKAEQPEAGILRELSEEIGFQADPGSYSLKRCGMKVYWHGLMRRRYYLFRIDLRSPLTPTIQSKELTDLAWFEITCLSSLKQTADTKLSLNEALAD